MESDTWFNNRKIQWLGLAFALALGGIALLRYAHTAWGGLALLAGAIFFGIACADHKITNFQIDLSGQTRFFRSRAALNLGIFFSVAAVLFSMHTDDSLLKGVESAVLWLLGVVLFSAGVLYSTGWTFIRWQDLKQWIISNRREILQVSLLLLFSLLIRSVALSSHPYAVANDEGAIAYDGIHLLRGDFHNLFSTATAAYPVLSYVPGALATLVFGNTIFGMRVISSIEGVLSILFLYLLCRDLFTRRVAWTSSILMAVLPVHIHYSRVGLNNILMCLHATLILWLMLRAIRNGKGSSYLWAGLATGAALYAYSGSRLMMALAGGIVLSLILFKRGYLKNNWRNVIIIGFSVLLVTLPQFVYFSAHPDLFVARSSAVGIFSTGWIYQESARIGEPVWKIFLNQVSEAVQIFISTHETIGFYAGSKPFFSLVESALLVLGMGFAFTRIRKSQYLLLLIWFWIVVYFGGVINIPANGTQRFIPALPAAVILIASALDQTAVLLKREIAAPTRLVNVFLGLLLSTVAVNGLVYYFYTYRIEGSYNRPYEEIQYETIQVQEQLGLEYRFVLIGAPRLYLEFGDYQYLLDGYDRSEIAEGQDLRSALLDQKKADLDTEDLLIGLTDDPARPTFYAAIPERVHELQTIARIYPGGSWFVETRRNERDEVLFYGYIIPIKNILLNNLVTSHSIYYFPWVTIFLVFFYLLVGLALIYLVFPLFFGKKAFAIYEDGRSHPGKVRSWLMGFWKELLQQDD